MNRDLFKDQSTIESDDEEMQLLENQLTEQKSIMVTQNDQQQSKQIAELKDAQYKLEDQLHEVEAEKQQSNLIIQDLK